LLDDDFQDGDFAGWAVVDEGTITAPSAWGVAGGALKQSSNIYSNVEGTGTAALAYLGTYAWYTAGTNWTDYQVTVPLKSTDDDALGVMVRFQDANNYYRFSWDQQRSYRRLMKVQGGTWTVLAEDSVPYVKNRIYQVEINVQGDTLSVRVDGELLFGGFITDSTPILAGSVGLYCWGNNSSFYEDVEVTAPAGISILSPQHGSLTTSPDVTILVGVGSLPPSWGVEFVIDGLTLNYDFTPPFEYTNYGLAPAEHTVDVHMVDLGYVRQYPYSASISFGVGDYLVAFGDSITRVGSHDDVAFDNISSDGRNSGGGYQPILNDLLTNERGYPHTVLTEGVSGDESFDGAARIDSVLARHPEAQWILVLLGTNDAFGTRPSGIGPGTPAPGTYEYYMQQIIDAIDPVATGRIPVLAKVPMRFGDSSQGAPYPNPETHPANLLIEEYNAVIDELKLRNPLIEVMTGPPAQSDNFFTYYRDLPRVNGRPIEFDDNLHVDGVGYQSMAWLWCETVLGYVCP